MSKFIVSLFGSDNIYFQINEQIQNYLVNLIETNLEEENKKLRSENKRLKRELKNLD